jgi:nucleotide-binding universal stress UspA family protein
VYLVQRQEKFSKILVAVDGSETSINAAGYAIAMAKKDNAQLIALTVMVKVIGLKLSNGLIRLERKLKKIIFN